MYVVVLCFLVTVFPTRWRPGQSKSCRKAKQALPTQHSAPNLTHRTCATKLHRDENTGATDTNGRAAPYTNAKRRVLVLCLSWSLSVCGGGWVADGHGWSGDVIILLFNQPHICFACFRQVLSLSFYPHLSAGIAEEASSLTWNITVSTRLHPFFSLRPTVVLLIYSYDTARSRR